MMLKLRSAEFDDHRPIRVNMRWVKFYYRHETGVTHLILGDGYQTDQFPVECIPVMETPEYIDACYEAKWPGTWDVPKHLQLGLTEGD